MNFFFFLELAGLSSTLYITLLQTQTFLIYPALLSSTTSGGWYCTESACNLYFNASVQSSCLLFQQAGRHLSFFFFIIPYLKGGEIRKPLKRLCHLGTSVTIFRTF